jgi:hypothetical protein
VKREELIQPQVKENKKKDRNKSGNASKNKA